MIAIVDDKQAQLALEIEAKRAEEVVAKLNAQNDVNSRDAIASEAIARAEAKTYQELHERGAAPLLGNAKEDQAEADRAILQDRAGEAERRHRDGRVSWPNNSQRKLAKLDIEMRTIRADFDAFVETRYAQLGEWVQPGSPIVELVQMDRLRVEGFIDALNYAGQVRIGSPVDRHGDDRRERCHRIRSPAAFPARSNMSARKSISGQAAFASGSACPNQRSGDDWLIKPGNERHDANHARRRQATVSCNGTVDKAPLIRRR